MHHNFKNASQLFKVWAPAHLAPLYSSKIFLSWNSTYNYELLKWYTYTRAEKKQYTYTRLHFSGWASAKASCLNSPAQETSKIPPRHLQSKIPPHPSFLQMMTSTVCFLFTDITAKLQSMRGWMQIIASDKNFWNIAAADNSLANLPSYLCADDAWSLNCPPTHLPTSHPDMIFDVTSCPLRKSYRK